MSDTIGGIAIAWGAVGSIVGASAQVESGLYYAYNGNPEPLRNSLIGIALGKIGVPAFAEPARDAAVEGILTSAEDAHACKP